MGRLEIFKEGAPYGSGPMQKLHQRQLAGWHCFDVKTLFRAQKLCHGCSGFAMGTELCPGAAALLWAQRLCLERESFAPAALRDFLSGCATLLYQPERPERDFEKKG